MQLEHLEALALSDDRDAALAALVPGTEDADAWAVIHHQHRGDLEGAERVLGGWSARHGDHGRYRTLALRQLILRADRDLAASAAALAHELGATLDHAREVEHEAAPHPTALDPALLDGDALLAEAVRRDRGLGGVGDEGLPALLGRVTGDLRRQLLGRLRRGAPGLLDAVVAELGEPASKGFGSLAAHQALTLAELDRLAVLVPTVRGQEAFVHARLARLRPPPHVDLGEPDVRAAHLDRLWAEVRDLPPVFVELKAHVLAHRLQVDRELGVVDRQRVDAWLSLPRRAPYASAGWLEALDQRHLASGTRDLSPVTGLGPTPADEALVRPLLAALLETEDGTAFADRVDRRWLDVLLAETRLLAGAPDPARWAALLGPVATTALRDRVDLELSPTLPRRYDRDDPVVLHVELKNAWPLRLRVFRINTAAWAAAHAGDVPLDLDLDGLAAGTEQVWEEPDLPPMRRVRRALPVPACERPGTYVVELVGQGRASRFLFHRGDLHAAVRPTPAGLTVVVLDERGRHRPEARIRLGARELLPDEHGAVALPFGARGPVAVVLVDGDLAVPATLDLPAETVGFRAGCWLDRQSLIAGAEARVLLRGDLRVGEAPAPLGLVEDPWVEVATVDRTGVAARRRQPIAWADDDETEVPFVVPEHLASLTIAVGGRFRLLGEPRHVDLRHELSVAVGTVNATDTTETALLTRDAEGWWLRLVGKTGEPRPGRALPVTVEHRWLTGSVERVLATDADGCVRLGALPQVRRLTARTAAGPDTVFDLGPDQPRLASRVVRHGEDVVLAAPIGADGAPPEVAVTELRGGAPAHDHSGCARREPGLVTLRGLPAGQHRVRLGTLELEVRVLPARVPVGAGVATLPDQCVVLEASPTALAAVEVGPEELSLRVVGATPATRIHLRTTPCWPAPLDPGELGCPPSPPRVRQVRRRFSARISSRDIGDEARYVLDRRRLPRRPGTLLERPSLLLAPWALRATTTLVRPAKVGASFGGPPAPAPSMSRQDRGQREEARSSSIGDPAFTAWDFLGEPPVLVRGLRPDADGRVVVPRSALGRGPVLRVVCVDPSGTTTRNVALPPAPLVTRDLRLAEALPDDRHQREDRRLVAVAPGASLRPAGARVAVVDTLEPLYRALCATGGHPELAAWDFLPRWGTLPRAERLALWDRHACHELLVFVRSKDPALFEDLRPTLAARLEPTFVDRWALGDDLTGFLAPHRLARLNAVERALLARALPDPDRAALVRALTEEVALRLPDRAADDRFVDTLLAGGDAPEEEPPMAEMLGEVSADEAPPEALDFDDAPKAKKGSGGPGGPPEAARRARAAPEPLFRPVERTREWAEHRWWQTRLADQGPQVVEVARLWRDLAAHREGPFLPTHLADAASSFAASVCALSFVELPFVAVRARLVDGELRVPGHALVAVAALAPLAGEPTGEVLVGQSTFRADDRWEWDGAERREKPVSGQLVTGVVHATEVVVTNPTARTRRLAVLVQIPAGAVAVGGGIATRTTRVELSPYATATVGVSWTMPLPGTFRQAGARVTDGDRLLAAAPSRAFEVVRVPTTTDTGSWSFVSQRGTLDQVVAFLRDRPLGREDLSRVAWRLREPDAFRRVLAALAERRWFDDTVWAYGLRHHDRDGVRAWLSRQGEVAALGPLACDLCTLDPVERGLEEHLEYAPLVVARAHRLGAGREVLNDGLAARWTAFLTRVATQPAPRPEDRLIAAQALLTLDRPEEAFAQLAKVPRSATPSVLQHDALSAWAAVHAGDLDAARALAAPWIDHPVPRWRQRFAAIVALVDEVRGAAPTGVAPDDRASRLDAQASRQPSLVARLDGAVLVLDSANLDRAELRAYGMDVELLFSRQPFLDAGGERFTLIDPGTVTAVPLDATGRTRIPLPEPLRRASVVLEVVAGPLRQVLTHFAHDLVLTPSPEAGQVQVRRASTGSPLPAAYVKVFARSRGGGVAFYKDGYTDLRGRFDHASLSTDDLDRVERFALLVVHDEAGATVLELPPPTR